MKLAFISDLHLSENTIEHNQLFYKLLQKWQPQLDALYILGDFFDYWLGDDDKTSFTLTMEQAFREFTQTTPIYFIHGNHDFAIGRDFAKRTGVKILKDCTTINVGHNKILLSHGDTFCSLDKSYQKFKKIIRNPLLLAILRRVPLKWRYQIKNSLEHESAKQFNQKPPETYLVVDETIAAMAQKHTANIVIHGHTHKPGRYLINHTKNLITRFEIPDWTDRKPGGYVLLEDGKIDIHYADFL
jgi:UDP-2,3-diacylglucosamine hydrolase